MKEALNPLEKRMMRALLRDPKDRVRKHWLISKLKHGSWLLKGTKKRDPFSGDVSFSFEHVWVPDTEGTDPLREA